MIPCCKTFVNVVNYVMLVIITFLTHSQEVLCSFEITRGFVFPLGFTKGFVPVSGFTRGFVSPFGFTKCVVFPLGFTRCFVFPLGFTRGKYFSWKSFEVCGYNSLN